MSEAPAHWFNDQEAEEGEAVLAVGLYFMWDMTVVTAEEPLVLQFDHHKSLRLLGVDNEISTRLTSAITEIF